MFTCVIVDGFVGAVVVVAVGGLVVVEIVVGTGVAGALVDIDSDELPPTCCSFSVG